MAAKKVADIMTKGAKVVTAKPDETAADVIKKLVGKKVSGLPVVGDDGVVIGIVSEADVLTARATTKVKKLIEGQELVWACPDMSVAEVAKLLAEKRIKRVPVVADGKLVGIVSRTDVLKDKIKPEQ